MEDKVGQGGRLIAAWATTNLGEDGFRGMVARREPSEPLDRAWRLGLLAEVHKARGEYELCKQCLKEAIVICRSVSPSDLQAALAFRRSLAFRQDLARAWQYLDHEWRAAAEEYKDLIQEWTQLSDADLDLAIVKRNYGECLRVLGGVENEKAPEDALADAALLASNFESTPSALKSSTRNGAPLVNRIFPMQTT